MTPEEYMQKALELATISSRQDEIPVGCLIVNSATGKIIASTHNLSQHSEDATAHAEILAIRQACKKLKQNRLWDMDMYVTLEPCTMCAAAISFARIKTLYFGAYDEKGGAVTSGVKFYEQKNCHHKPNVLGGILENECSQILKNFFKNKRQNKKEN
ncbi:MAG: nucleoside deaminase [Alphaproteobacteria bacterium]|nr:nucleoside deaminase [Alphaproteobacteria bacterium]